MLRQADTIKVWTGPLGDDGTSELDTGQVWIPVVTYPTQGTQKIIRLQVPDLRS